VEKDLRINAVLDFVGSVLVHAVSTTFKAVEHFVEKTDSRSRVTFDKSNLDRNFWVQFLRGEGKIEPVEARTELYCYLIKDHLRACDILTAIGDVAKAETTLADLYELLLKQPNGEKGILHAGPHELNLFFIRNLTGELKAVRVHWWNEHWEISIGGTTVTDGTGFGAGHKVFLRHLVTTTDPSDNRGDGSFSGNLEKWDH
jgi:hypothetical protein